MITGFAKASISVEAPQMVAAVLRAIGGRVATTPVVLSLAMTASRL